MELVNLHLFTRSILASCFWRLNLIMLSVVWCAGLLGANKGIVVESFHHPDLISPLHSFSNVMNFTSLELIKLNLRPPPPAESLKHLIAYCTDGKVYQ